MEIKNKKAKYAKSNQKKYVPKLKWVRISSARFNLKLDAFGRGVRKKGFKNESKRKSFVPRKQFINSDGNKKI